jgi:hypothetical protein
MRAVQSVQLNIFNGCSTGIRRLLRTFTHSFRGAQQHPLSCYFKLVVYITLTGAYCHDFAVTIDGVWTENRIYLTLTERNYK